MHLPYILFCFDDNSCDLCVKDSRFLMYISSFVVMLECVMDRPDAFTQVRSRVDSEAVVATSFKQNITPQLSLTLCSEV
jgi:hypothetical protein